MRIKVIVEFYNQRLQKGPFWQNEAKIMNLFNKSPFTGPSLPFARGREVIDRRRPLLASNGSLHARTDEGRAS
jgi:hypothetical protein